MAIGVLVVDDQPLLRQGFGMVLEAQEGIHVVGEAADGEEAVRGVVQLRPDVVLMDVRLPRMDGIEATRRIVASGSPARVLILTTFDLDEYAFAGLAAGASGFLLKDVPPGELTSAIRAVASGEAVVSPRITRRLLDEHLGRRGTTPDSAEDDRSQFETLTDREHEVLLALAEGLSNAEIAARLFMAEATVKTHVTRILSKLGLRDRVQVVIFAYRAGLITP